MDHSGVEAEEVDLARAVEAERGDPVRRVADLEDGGQLAVLLLQGPDPAGLVVAEDVFAHQGRELRPPIDEPARDRRADPMAVGEDRGDVLRVLRGVAVRVASVALEDVPAVVLARADDRHFLVLALADVADPEVARLRVEAEPPGLAEAPSPDLRQRTGPTPERVVGRDSIRPIPLGMVDVDPEHLAQEDAQVLAMASRVFLGAGVAHADVEEPVGAEGQVTAVVDLAEDGDLQYELRGPARVAQTVLGRLPLDDVDHQPACPGRAVEFEEVAAIPGEVGVERDAGNPGQLAGGDLGAEVGEEAPAGRGPFAVDQPDPPALHLDDHLGPRSSRHRPEPDGPVERRRTVVDRPEHHGTGGPCDLSRVERLAG